MPETDSTAPQNNFHCGSPAVPLLKDESGRINFSVLGVYPGSFNTLTLMNEISAQNFRAVRQSEPSTDSQAREIVKHSPFRNWLDHHPKLHFLHKIFVFLLGLGLIFAGIIMLVLPGPGFLTIFLGLAVMGTEFPLAKRLLSWLRAKVTQHLTNARERRKRKRSSRV